MDLLKSNGTDVTKDLLEYYSNMESSFSYNWLHFLLPQKCYKNKKNLFWINRYFELNSSKTEIKLET